MKVLAGLAMVGLLTACTTTLYVGKTTFKEGNDVCTTQAYWTKTDYLLGVKADRVMTVIADGARKSVEFKELDGQIAYLGVNKEDKKVFGDSAAGESFVCGWVQGLPELVKFEGKELTVYMHCKAKTDALSKSKGYLPAQEQPYVYVVSEQRSSGWFGKTPAPPVSSKCEPVQ